MAYFPVFVNMDGKKCLVVGGGKVACRKVKMLLDFGLQVTVIAPIVSDEIKALGQVTIVEQQIKLSLIKDYYLVIAATDQVEINRKIAEECKKNNKLVNVVNAPEFGDFICPAYLKSGNVVAAFSSGGSSPVIAQYLKETVSPVMTESLGKQAEYIKSVRDRVKSSVPGQEDRKKVYEQIWQFCQNEKRVPTEEEFVCILEEIIGCI